MATVDSNGKVTGVRAGTATITATAHGVSRTCVVTVKKPTFTVSPDSYTVKVGKTVKINAYTVPAATIKYSSLRSSVAKVSATGQATGVKAGTAKIRVTANNRTEYVKITVVQQWRNR